MIPRRSDKAEASPHPAQQTARRYSTGGRGPLEDESMDAASGGCGQLRAWDWSGEDGR